MTGKRENLNCHYAASCALQSFILQTFLPCICMTIFFRPDQNINVANFETILFSELYFKLKKLILFYFTSPNYLKFTNMLNKLRYLDAISVSAKLGKLHCYTSLFSFQ